MKPLPFLYSLYIADFCVSCWWRTDSEGLVFHAAYMSSPCHIELVLSEKESGIKAEQTVKPSHLPFLVD